MMATLKDLAERMREITGNLGSEVARCASEAAMDIQTYLAFNTPVDTSNALSNWQVSLDSPILDETEPYLVGSKGSTKFASAAMAVQEAGHVLKGKRFGQSIFIANNAPYIEKLDSGEVISRTAPPHFVDAALIVGRQSVKKFKLKLR